MFNFDLGIIKSYECNINFINCFYIFLNKVIFEVFFYFNIMIVVIIFLKCNFRIMEYNKIKFLVVFEIFVYYFIFIVIYNILYFIKVLIYVKLEIKINELNFKIIVFYNSFRSKVLEVIR